MLPTFARLALVAHGSHATLSPPSRPPIAGRAWSATLVVRPAPRKSPRVVARPPTGSSLVFGAKRVGRGTYKVRVVLPRVGRWTLAARIGGRTRALRSVNVSPVPPPTSPLPGGTAFRVCGGAREPFLQYGLSIGYGSVWLACRNLDSVQRVDPETGRVLATIELAAPVWTVSAGADWVWANALREGDLERIDPASNRRLAPVVVPFALSYAWAAGDSLWAADDEGRSIVRTAPTGAAWPGIPVGNGPAGLAYDGSFVWILNHRENTLERIDPATNGVTRMGQITGGDQVAAERIAAYNGLLWVTGRGLDLLRVSPANGAVVGSTEIGTGGIAVVTDGANLWVVVYTPEGDARGEPLVASVLKIDTAGGI